MTTTKQILAAAFTVLLVVSSVGQVAALGMSGAAQPVGPASSPDVGVDSDAQEAADVGLDSDAQEPAPEGQGATVPKADWSLPGDDGANSVERKVPKADWSLPSSSGTTADGPSKRDSDQQSQRAEQHDYPAAKNLGYGAPSAGTYGEGQEFTIGGAPVPPSSKPTKGAKKSMNFLGDHSTGNAEAPTSIETAVRAADAGKLDEIGSQVNSKTLEGAGETSTMTAMTKAEQAKGMSASLSSPSKACPDGANVKTFNVSAIQVDIVYNKYGQHDPNGVMYVLDSKKDDVREYERTRPNATIENPDMNATSELVQPLTMRVNVGDCVKVQFTNELNKSASMSLAGVSYNPNSSAGSAVGFNEESIASPGETVNYTWHVEKKGAYFFTDKAQSVLHDKDKTLRQHGLFGSLVAAPEGVEWRDPETGNPTKTGVKAMAADPDGPDYRDFAVYYHDGVPIENADGSSPKWPHSDANQSMYVMNYRGDPTGARLRERNNSTCPACSKPELFYSSWVHGDPGGGDLVFPTYQGDPVKWRLIGAQVEEKHVDHHHGHRWKSEPGDAKSNTQDAQTISAGATYTREFVAGFGNGSSRTAMGYEEAFKNGSSGYVQGSPGDYIFHCHLFPHYASGMWSIMRVYDKDTRDMNQSAPGVYKLQPLPDRAEPPAPNNSSPGYPNFIPAKEDHRPPKPPGEAEGRDPTAMEESALNGTGKTDTIKPGAPYADPCPENATVQRYNISIIQTNITYNKNGDYDPKATIYVLSKHVDEIRNGTMEPKPLVIRANVGQCVEINLTNELPADHEPNEVSMHVHFVGYDALGSDGVTLGYNYDEGAEPLGDNESRLVDPKNGSSYRVPSDGTKSYRWYADERGTIFWHDHLIGFEKGMHGVFGTLIVEPKNSTWLDPQTGEPIRTGTKAMIKDPNGQNHREFVLLYQDWVRLRDGQTGEPINGPFTNTPLSTQGTMGINYANAPLYHRNDSDPANAFSSWNHGDPKTPLLQTYPGEPVKIRVLQGTFEEAHNFMLSGVRWKQEQNDKSSPLKGVQTFGVSTQYVASFDAPKDNPADLEVEDHLYGSMPVNDLWNGMWGLFRVYGSEVDHLEPLPGHSAPDGFINDSELSMLNETNDAPPKVPTAGEPCPADAEKRTYSVVAFRANISYNEYGDHDPYGVVFATEENYLDWKNNGTALEPLTLRAEKGECVEITLTNKLPQNMSDHAKHPGVAVDSEKWNESNRISLHSTLLNYTARSSGITTGYNYQQTIGPGETRTYRFHADKQVGASALFDMADVRYHRSHGAYGALVVEPKNSTWLDPQTGQPGKATGSRAIVVLPDGEDFREYVAVMADGQYMVNPDGSCPVPPVGHADSPDAPCNQAHGEPTDQGYKSVNYASEPLPRRLENGGKEALAFSSKVHGDPATPVFEAYRGDPVKFRVVQGADRERGISFKLGGHVFPYQSTEKTQYVGVRGEITPGVSTDIVPYGGAGGPQAVPGDYYYGATKLKNYVEGGLWGIFRVHDQPAGVEPLPDRRPAAPSNLSVQGTTQHTVDLDWDDHANPDVEGYNVYRSVKDGGPYTKVNDELLTNSTFTDTNRTPGATYYYVVTAVDTYGQESAESNQTNATTDPLLTVDADTDQALSAAVNTNVTVEVKAESDIGMGKVRFTADDGTAVAKNMSYNNTTGLYELTVDVSKLSEGEHLFQFVAEDEREDDHKDERGPKHQEENEHGEEKEHDDHGHEHESDEDRWVTVDTVEPDAEVTVDGTAAGNVSAIQTGSIDLEVNATDNTTGVEQVRYRIDDGTWQNLTEHNATWSESINTSVLADGSHQIDVEVEDGAGNVYLKRFSIDTDNSAPATETKVDGTLASALDATMNGNASLSVDATDAVSGVEDIEYKLDDGSWHALTDDDGDGVWEAVIDTTTLSDGGHVLKIKGKDTVGNVKVKKLDIDVDNTDPTEATSFDGTEVSLLDSPLSGTSTLEVDADDATSGVESVEIELDDGGWETVTDSDGDGVWETDIDTSTLSDGGHVVKVRVKDKAGNVHKTKYSFDTDNTDPSETTSFDGTEVSLLDAALSGTSTLEIDADDTSGVETVEFKLDDDSWETATDADGDGVWETDINTSTLSDGAHNVTVRTTDAAGNEKRSQYSFDVDNTEPTFDAYLGGTLIGLLETALSGNVTLEVDAADAVSSIETVEFEIDDNGYETVTDADGDGVWETDIDTTKYSDGSHVIKVKTVDAAGNVKIKKFTIEIDNLV